jgi:2-C-methyl-D-erythritol 4-phosphate cytidylyltransferase
VSSASSPPPGEGTAIVIVAAGSSIRMGFDKIWADLGGRPLLAHSVHVARCCRPAELVVVVAPERVAAARELAPAATVVDGGARRRDSVAAGLAATAAPWVAVHDAARALVAPRLFRAGFAAARATGAALPALPLKDTVKRVVGGRVRATLPRAEHVVVQTPQVFRRDLLERALALSDEDVTDEAALVERLGVEVATFEGDERNFKVTTPFDLALARRLLAEGDVPMAR